MNNNSLATLYALGSHIASIAAVATLMGTGHLTETVGAPILAGLVGIGLGAGTALIVPGASQLPSGPPGPSNGTAGAAPPQHNPPVPP